MYFLYFRTHFVSYNMYVDYIINPNGNRNYIAYYFQCGDCSSGRVTTYHHHSFSSLLLLLYTSTNSTKKTTSIPYFQYNYHRCHFCYVIPKVVVNFQPCDAAGSSIKTHFHSSNSSIYLERRNGEKNRKYYTKTYITIIVYIMYICTHTLYIIKPIYHYYPQGNISSNLTRKKQSHFQSTPFPITSIMNIPWYLCSQFVLLLLMIMVNDGWWAYIL